MGVIRWVMGLAGVASSLNCNPAVIRVREYISIQASLENLLTTRTLPPNYRKMRG
jgi:hypothetical protein